MDETKEQWTCPKCKAANEPDISYCRVCARRNPALPEAEKTCAKCGFSTTKTCCPACNSELFLQL
jgi:RNA polymerase subunit RPABC4/transcription elongation factor Spt4